MRRAIRRCADREAELLVVFVAEPMEDNPITQQLTDQSFISLGQSRDVMEEVKHNTLKDATRRLQRIERRATKQNVPCETDLVEGNFFEQILEIAQMKQVDRIYLCGKKRGKLGQLIHGTEVDELIEGAPCKVVVVGKDG